MASINEFNDGPSVQNDVNGTGSCHDSSGTRTTTEDTDFIILDDEETGKALAAAVSNIQATIPELDGTKEDVLTAVDEIDDSLMVVDEWEDEELLREAERKYDELNDTPDSDEKTILTMPSLSHVLYDVSRGERIITVHSLSMADLSHPEFMKVGEMVACDNFKVRFIRPKNVDSSWKGFATIHFISVDEANEAAECLKKIGDHIVVRIETKSENCSKDLDKWEKAERTENKLSGSLILVVKNLPPGTTVGPLKEIFPDAKNIVVQFPRESSSSSSTSRKKEDAATATPPRIEGMAYVIFCTIEKCMEYAEKYLTVRPEVGGRRLRVYAYREPAKQIPACLLALSERRTLFLAVEKLGAIIEANKSADPPVKISSAVEREHKACADVLDRDNRTRKFLNIAAPTLEELNAMERLPKLDEAKTKALMKRMHITDRDCSRDRSRDRHDTSGRRRSGHSRDRSRERRRRSTSHDRDSRKRSHDRSSDKKTDSSSGDSKRVGSNGEHKTSAVGWSGDHGQSTDSTSDINHDAPAEKICRQDVPDELSNMDGNDMFLLLDPSVQGDGPDGEFQG